MARNKITNNVYKNERYSFDDMTTNRSTREIKKIELENILNRLSNMEKLLSKAEVFRLKLRKKRLEKDLLLNRIKEKGNVKIESKKKISCPFCLKKFTSSQGVNQHIKDKHEKSCQKEEYLNNLVHCKYCQVPLNEKNVEKHLKNKCPNYKEINEVEFLSIEVPKKIINNEKDEKNEEYLNNKISLNEIVHNEELEQVNKVGINNDVNKFIKEKEIGIQKSREILVKNEGDEESENIIQSNNKLPLKINQIEKELSNRILDKDLLKKILLTIKTNRNFNDIVKIFKENSVFIYFMNEFYMLHGEYKHSYLNKNKEFNFSEEKDKYKIEKSTLMQGEIDESSFQNEKDESQKENTPKLKEQILKYKSEIEQYDEDVHDELLTDEEQYYENIRKKLEYNIRNYSEADKQKILRQYVYTTKKSAIDITLRNEIRSYLYKIYRGYCQICGFTFRKPSDGENSFEMHNWDNKLVVKTKSYLVSSADSLCLCRNCSANIKFGSFNPLFVDKIHRLKNLDEIKEFISNKVDRKDVVERFQEYYDWDDMYTLEITMNDEPKNIYMTNGHLIQFIAYLQLDEVSLSK